MFTDGEPKFISHFHWCYAPKRLEVGDFFQISLNQDRIFYPFNLNAFWLESHLQ
ncbi:hypothetical protein C8U37_11518 [Trichococcus patagoniensis]|uniref:Uncharacterized protein n=1 Tax=Trichococcus patagoniensis TaxID=382641 RepID=A0A2T5IGL0_9LACT|nr:hypothetical protein C8U37_11518 [Trichococcus patagoniensis]